jgi:hypothetical protein
MGWKAFLSSKSELGWECDQADYAPISAIIVGRGYTMDVKAASASSARFFKAESDSRTSHSESQSCKEQICDFFSGQSPEMRKSDS